jgi:hypothetical protein
MLWLAERVEIERTLLVLSACDCARTALPYVPAGEDRPRVAIETTEAWCRGEATIEQVRAASAYAYASHAASASAYASYASYASHAASAYAYASHAASAYAAHAASASARVKAHRWMAGLVRARISVEMIEERI